MSKLDVTPEATQQRIDDIKSQIATQRETIKKIQHDLVNAQEYMGALVEDLNFWNGE